jgi:2-iminobutanoate/2-iminopropanoate deaminase
MPLPAAVGGIAGLDQGITMSEPSVKGGMPPYRPTATISGFSPNSQLPTTENPMREVIATGNAPKAIGPYSQAIRAGGMIFCSGQIALDPATNQLVEGNIAAQTERVLKNLSAVLWEAGSNLEQVVKTTVFLKSMNDFAAMNEVYGKFFTKQPPARSTVEAARLPRDVLVEIDVIAVL